MKPELVHDWNLRQNARVGNRCLKDPSSPEWAYQAVDFLKLKWHAIDLDHKHFLDMVNEIVRNKSWAVIPTDAPYGDLDTMFRAELGVSEADVMKRVEVAEMNSLRKKHESITTAMIATKPSLAGENLAESRAKNGGKGGRPKKDHRDNHAWEPRKVIRPGGQDNEYVIRRLARIDLDTGSTWVARYQAGEFPSIAAMGRAAGIPIGRNVKLGKPQTVAATLVRLMGPDYVAEIVSEIRKLLND